MASKKLGDKPVLNEKQKANMARLTKSDARRRAMKKVELVKREMQEGLGLLIQVLSRDPVVPKPTPAGEAYCKTARSRLGIIAEILEMDAASLSPPVLQLTAETLADISDNFIKLGAQLDKRRSSEKFRKAGHAAYSINWLSELDSRSQWMERVSRGSGMGWKVSAQAILSVLERDERFADRIPDARTVNRERRRRLDARKYS